MPQHMPGRRAVTIAGDRHGRTTQLKWMAEGTAFVADQLGPSLDLRESSLLPGWSRAHVVAHLVGNAIALGNLLRWARTGVESPMYPDPHSRAREIDEWARLPDTELRDRMRSTSDRLRVAVNDLPAEAWDVRVRSAFGRDIPAREALWLRNRELWVHGVDLDAGLWFDSLPAAFVDTLFDEVVTTFNSRTDTPALTLVPTDRPTRWNVGSWPAEHFEEVHGSVADLLGWLIGRAGGNRRSVESDQPLPDLAGWL
jgi:maleylpyruvate isomerase